MVLEAGKMFRPIDMHNEPGGEAVYVVEKFNHRVSKWTFNEGTFDPFILDVTWGSNSDGTSGLPGKPTGPTDEFLQFPHGIAEEGGNLLVCDTLNNRVRKIDRGSGNFVGTIGSPGTGDGELYRPLHIANEFSTNFVAVTDSRNHRVSVFNANNDNFIQQFPEPSPDTFQTPNGITFANGNFFVSDILRQKIYRYDDSVGSYAFLGEAGQPGTDPTVPEDLFFPGSGRGAGTGTQHFFSDTRNNSLKTVDNSDIILIEKASDPGTGDGQLYWPESMDGFSEGGEQYRLAMNTRNNRVEVYNSTYTFQNSFGSP